MWTRLSLVCAVSLFFLSGLPLAAQAPEAFVLSEEEHGPAPSPGAVRSWRMAVRFEVLQGAPPRLGLPLGVGESRVADLTGFERRKEDDYTWRGRMADGEGTVTLTVRGPVLAGFIEAGNAVYEIVPRERGISSLVLLDSDLFPECGTTREKHAVNAPPGPASGGAAAPAGSAAPDTGARIDVMVLYTATARQGAGGTANMQATVQAAVDAANTAYGNSQIVQRLRLVHMAEVAYNEAAAGGYDAHLNWVSTDSAVAALRETYRADLVDLMVQDSEYCGIASLMINVGPSFASNAFSVTTRGCAVGNFSFAHELGHNMAAHHDPANAGSAVYPYAYGHFVNGSFRTVMSYSTQCTSGCTRVSRFSNPGVTYLGSPTGIANARDNHRTLNNTADVVANFRQEAVPPVASDYYTLEPCRVIDTRGGPALLSGVPRDLDVAGLCGIPTDAKAVVLNVTVIGPTGSGNLILYPAGQTPPTASTINFAPLASRANNAILALPGDGSGTLAALPLVSGGGSVHVVLDAFGYFAVPAEEGGEP